MARMRKDKLLASTSSSLRNTRSSSARGKTASTEAQHKKDRKGKARDEGGIELVTERQAEDPSLAKDVSAFLSGLTLSNGAISSPKHKPKQQEKLNRNSQQRAHIKTHQPEKYADASHQQQKKKGKTKVSLPEQSSESESFPSLIIPTPAVATTKLRKFTVDPGSQWYTFILPLPPALSVPAPTAQQLTSLSERAKKHLQVDAELYASKSLSSGDASFMQTILKSGTLSDRLSALTLMVQGSPVHNVKALESLKSMMERGKGKGREESLKAIRCVVDWWVGGGGPGRKLKYFRDQPLLHPAVTDAHLVLWHFEDWLKKYIFSVLQVLEAYSLDPLPYVRTQSLSFITTLLKEQPEQEQNLLRLLVNKLGDTEKAICSRASYHLLQVLQAHPNMKSVIVREAKALIFRPVASSAAAASASATAHAGKQHAHIRFGDDEEQKLKGNRSTARKSDSGKEGGKERTDRWNSHAWYYAAVTLNQVVLTPSDADKAVARTLLGVYFEMFEEILGAGRGKGDGNAVMDDHKEAEEAETGGKARKGGKVRGKEKEVRGAAGFAEVEDATSRLLSAVLTGVNRALPFAKVDVAGDDVFQKHIDTLFLITHTSTFNISLQALLLILQITTSIASHPSSATSLSFATALQDRFYRTLYASLIDPRLGESNKQAMYLNLLFKALKVDRNLGRVKAFVRRFVQMLAIGIGGSGGAEFIAGGLYLLGELFQTIPGLRTLLGDVKGKGRVVSQGGEEQGYDPRKRDPQFANASASPMYELLPLLHHYHPAISLHARQLLASTPLTASPDLALNTLNHFLDRFVYKNPKKPRTKGPSAMQPAASAADGTGVKMTKGEVADEGGMLMNEENWWRKKVEDIPTDQVFFHKYFTQKKKREDEKAAKVSKRKGRGDAEDEDEDEEGTATGSEGDGDDSNQEAEIWKAMKASMPAELQDDELVDDSEADGDEDVIPSDLDDDGVEGSDTGSVRVQSESSDESVDDKDLGDHGESGDGDDGAFSLAEASDAEDLIPLHADMPVGLIEYDGSDASASDLGEEEWHGIGSNDTAGKRKRGAEKREEGKKRRLHSLPTFASYEDYARMIENGPEDNI